MRYAANDGCVVSNFIVRALKSEPITIYGEGKQTWSFCYMDLIECFLHLVDTETGFTGSVNLGYTGAFSISGLAEKVIKPTYSRSALFFRPLSADEPMQRQPDISLAQQKVGWEPKVRLIDGLQHTIAYFDELLSATQ